MALHNNWHKIVIKFHDNIRRRVILSEKDSTWKFSKNQIRYNKSLANNFLRDSSERLFLVKICLKYVNKLSTGYFRVHALEINNSCLKLTKHASKNANIKWNMRMYWEKLALKIVSENAFSDILRRYKAIKRW